MNSVINQSVIPKVVEEVESGQSRFSEGTARKIKLLLAYLNHLESPEKFKAYDQIMTHVNNPTLIDFLIRYCFKGYQQPWYN